MSNIFTVAGSAEASRELARRRLVKAHFMVVCSGPDDVQHEYFAATIRGADKIFNEAWDHARIYELHPQGKRALVDRR